MADVLVVAPEDLGRGIKQDNTKKKFEVDLSDYVDNLTTYIHEEKIKAVGTTYLYGDIVDLNTFTFATRQSNEDFSNAVGTILVKWNDPTITTRDVVDVPSDFTKEANKRYTYDLLVHKVFSRFFGVTDIDNKTNIKKVKLVIREVTSGNPEHAKVVGVWEREQVYIGGLPQQPEWSEWVRLDNTEAKISQSAPTYTAGRGVNITAGVVKANINTAQVSTYARLIGPFDRGSRSANRKVRARLSIVFMENVELKADGTFLGNNRLDSVTVKFIPKGEMSKFKGFEIASEFYNHTYDPATYTFTIENVYHGISYDLDIYLIFDTMELSATNNELFFNFDLESTVNGYTGKMPIIKYTSGLSGVLQYSSNT